MTLEAELTQALEGTMEAAKAMDYFPTYFMQMLAKYEVVETAKRLLAYKELQSGLFKLFEFGLLIETMEAVVVQNKFKSLFTEGEIAEAKRRLVLETWERIKGLEIGRGEVGVSPGTNISS